MSTATVSASVDSTTKAIANARIREAGQTPNGLIKSVWEHIAATGEVPNFDLHDDERGRRSQAFARLEALRAKTPQDTPLSTMNDEEIRKEIRDREL